MPISTASDRRTGRSGIRAPRRSRRARTATVLSLAVVAMLPAACSSNGDEDADGGDRSTTTAGPTTSSGESTTSAAPQTSGPPATAETTDPVGVELLEPVGLEEPVDWGGGVTVEAVTAEDIDVVARAPGETSGPGVAVTLEVTNGSDEPFDLAGLAIAGTQSSGVPASTTDGPPAKAFAGVLAPGASAEAVVVFRVDDRAADELVVEAQSNRFATVPRFRV